MVIRPKYILLPMVVFFASAAMAQDDYEQFRRQKEQQYESFRKKNETEFEEFRRRVNNEYAAFVERTWRAFNAFKGTPIPKEDPVPPIIRKDDKEEKRDQQLDIDVVIPPAPPTPQPQPITPIEKQPQPVPQFASFTFFGTTAKVQSPDNKHKLTLSDVSEKSVATAWKNLSDGSYDNMLNDCLKLRNSHRLCDWSYLLMLQQLADSYCGKGNAANLLCAWLYCQSGYKMRLANSNGRLIMLYASRHSIYGKPYWTIDNDYYYPFADNVGERLSVCEVGFPKEQQLSLEIDKEQQLQLQSTKERTFQSKRYADMRVTASTNKNLIDFYNTYPTSCINNDFGTRWAMYANAPLSQQARQRLYPLLDRLLQGKSQLDAVNRILNLLQTALVYEYDDKVWGHDRAFFPDETLYYPYADCEDRAILLSRIVRDVLHQKVVLIYYPGHLAAAVNFTQQGVKGDYVLVQGQRYYICDPTYIGAPVGETMPNMNNSQAKIILLE